MYVYIYVYIYTSVSPCIKCTEKPWNRAYKNMTYRIWVHSLPHSGDLRMHEHSDEPFANLVQWNRTCKYTRRTLSTWKDHQTRLGKCENAKAQSFQGHSVDNELGLRTSCQARSLNTAKMIHDKIIDKKRKHTNTIETVNTARLHDQWNGRLSTCLLKASLAHEKSAAKWKKAKQKNIHLTSIFSISDQRPKKFPKWGSGISKWAFSGQAEG